MTDPDQFNPSEVPAFPTVHMRATTNPDGTVRGEVDGLPVQVDQAHPNRSLISEAATKAALRPLQAVRVSATDVNDATWLMIVHADGRTWDLDSLDAKGPKRGGTSKRTVAALAGGTLLFAAAGLGSAWAISANKNEAPPPAPTAAPAGEAPVVPVQGWARRAGWVSPVLTDGDAGGPPAFLTKAGVITTLAKDGGCLAALRPEDGATLWTKPLPEDLTSPPQAASFQGREAISAATRNTLTVWPATANPTPTRWEFTEADMEMVPSSTVPLLASEETSTALVLHGTQLEKRVLPAGSTPVSADDKGRVAAVDDHGRWWRLTDEDTAPRPTQLQPPTYGAEATEVLGLAGRTLLVAWEDDEGTLVSGFATESSMEPVWSKRVDKSPRSSDLSVAPNGSWLVVGETAIQTEDGTAKALPKGWKTSGMTNIAAWSKEHMVPRFGTPKELTDEVEDEEGIPVATTSRHGLIVAEDAKGPRIFALENDPGRHYDAGEAVTPRPSGTSTTSAKPKAKSARAKKTTAKKTAGSSPSPSSTRRPGK